MIRYALQCGNGDQFEAWFGSIAEYDRQAAEGLISCPLCADVRVEKAVMAPAVRPSRGKAGSRPEQDPRASAMAMAGRVREMIRENFDYVGERFAAEARKIHAGQAEERPIWGEATPAEARAMAEEGVPVAPLPPALAPIPPKKLN